MSRRLAERESCRVSLPFDMALLLELAQQAKALPPELKGLTLDQLISFADICSEYAADVEDSGIGDRAGVEAVQLKTSDIRPASAEQILPPTLASTMALHTALDVTTVQTLWDVTQLLRVVAPANNGLRRSYMTLNYSHMYLR